MSWGCYRHEVDMGSDHAEQALALLVEWEEARGFPAWGRDEAICPFCYVELLHFARLAYLHLRALDQSSTESLGEGQAEVLALGQDLFEHERHSLPLLDDNAEEVLQLLGGTDDEVEKVDLAG